MIPTTKPEPCAAADSKTLVEAIILSTRLIALVNERRKLSLEMDIPPALLSENSKVSSSGCVTSSDNDSDSETKVVDTQAILSGNTINSSGASLKYPNTEVKHSDIDTRPADTQTTPPNSRLDSPGPLPKFSDNNRVNSYDNGTKPAGTQTLLYESRVNSCRNLLKSSDYKMSAGDIERILPFSPILVQSIEQDPSEPPRPRQLRYLPDGWIMRHKERLSQPRS